MARLLRAGQEVQTGDYLADDGQLRIIVGPELGDPGAGTVHVEVFESRKRKILPGRPPIVAFASNTTGDGSRPEVNPGNEVFGHNEGYFGHVFGTRHIQFIPGTTQQANYFAYSRRFQTGFPWTLEFGCLRVQTTGGGLPATWMSDFGMTIWNETTDTLHRVVVPQGVQNWDQYVVEPNHLNGRTMTRWLWDGGNSTWGLQDGHRYAWIRDDYSQYPPTVVKPQSDHRYEFHPAAQYDLEWDEGTLQGGAPLVNTVARGKPIIDPQTGGLTFRKE